MAHTSHKYAELSSEQILAHATIHDLLWHFFSKHNASVFLHTTQQPAKILKAACNGIQDHYSLLWSQKLKLNIARCLGI